MGTRRPITIRRLYIILLYVKSSLQILLHVTISKHTAYITQLHEGRCGDNCTALALNVESLLPSSFHIQIAGFDAVISILKEDIWSLEHLCR